MDEILKKLDIFLSDEDANEANVYSVGYPNYPYEEYRGTRPIQFLRWWGEFRPGDRADVTFFKGEDKMTIVSTNSEGNFSGVKKHMEFDDNMEITEFKDSEGKIWNFC